MTLMETVKGTLGEMTKSERQVAAYYFANAGDFAFFTLDKMADSVETSTTSVLRFCRRLGFAGYKDFQQAVRQELHRQPDLLDKLHRTQSSDDLLNKTLSQNMACIQNTFAAMPYDRLVDTVGLLTKARRVYTFGMKESFALAHYAYTRFGSVRPEVHLLGAGVNGEVEKILDLTGEDVCLVYLFHRYTKQTLCVLETLKNRGIPVVLVTAAPYDQVEAFATILLPCFVDAEGIKNTAVAPICLADYLCNAMAVAGGEAAAMRMQQLEKLYKEQDVLGY
ncbi:MAG: MurR/RpiR family transcriptional regulator [Clostridia bacterium]|nr:MurR/RpiR family transcriptional regulator [Clostridia bacterium]